MSVNRAFGSVILFGFWVLAGEASCGQTRDQSLKSLEQMTSQLKHAKYDSGSVASEEFVAIARSRIKLLTSLLEAREPRAKLCLLNQEFTNNLPKALQAEIETRSWITGRVIRLVVDDFENCRSHSAYFLDDGKQVLRFYPPEGNPQLRNGQKIRADGVMGHSVFFAESIVSIGNAPANVFPQGPFNVLVLLVDFPSSPAPLFNRIDIKRYWFGDTSGSRRFYRESSYGKSEMTGDAYGWYLLPDSILTRPGQDAGVPGTQELAQIIQDHNIDLSKYDHVVWLMNTEDGFVGAGMGTIDRNDYSILRKVYKFGTCFIHAAGRTSAGLSANGMDYVLCHELGHNLNLDHPDLWDPTTDSFFANGSPVDVMSYGSSQGGGYLHTALHKKQLGWLDSTNILEIRQTGDYTLRPLEGSLGMRGAEIFASDTTRFGVMLEYRNGTGFDSGMKSMLPENTRGIIANVSWGYFGYEQYASLIRTMVTIDLDYTSPTTFLEVALRDSSRIELAGAHIRLGPIHSLSDSAVTFHVDILSKSAAIGDLNSLPPTRCGLDQNYPNPFNPSTKIQFTIAKRQLTIVKVFDVLGRDVATLVNEVKEPGTYTVQFDGSHLASGVYFYRLQAGNFVATKQLLLLK